MKYAIKKRKKLLILCSILLFLLASYYGTIFHIKRTVSIEIDASDTFQDWEIQSAMHHVIADFTIWHPLSPHQYATIQSISYCEETCDAEWIYYSDYQNCKRKNFLVIECTFLTDDHASEKVIGMTDHTICSQYWIFTRKAKFLPWILQDQGYA
ncbi:MAG: hypothetical protein ACI4TG_07540 [Ruminococcus sp.]